MLTLLAAAAAACGGSAKGNAADSSADSPAADGTAVSADVPAFSADSAMAYLTRQMEFGPRVPNTPAHKATGDWLVAELTRRGAVVTEQRADLRAFDGTVLHARNIFARFSPEAGDRLLLLAHYDTRPWADEDPEEANRTMPVPGANDGASGVAVLLETARHIAAKHPGRGVDILFVDAEDYGTDGDEDSWALGAKYFAQNPPVKDYSPTAAILLDMVGGDDAIFPAEYFSVQAAPELDAAFRAAAARAGYAQLFPSRIGGGVTDDHVQLIEAGIPCIDIIDYRAGTGFCPTWHTLSDDLQHISPATLQAVGSSLLHYIYQ